MKKNGFIATSILYSFFLVFITLFVALITNYLHNQVLLSAMDEEARDTLRSLNNMHFSELKIGDSVRFTNTITNAAVGVLALNENATWIVANIENDPSTGKKIYYLLSDFKANAQVVSRQLPGEGLARRHLTTIQVIDYLSTTNKGDGYKDSMKFYTKQKNTLFPSADDFWIGLPTASLLSKVRKLNIQENIKEAILGAKGDYAVEIDTGNQGGFTKAGSEKSYALLRRYNFPMGSQQNSLVPKYCKSSYDGTTLSYANPNRDVDNGFGYTHIVAKGVNATQNIGNYVDFCLYASPTNYTHNSEEKVVSVTETDKNDIITITTSAPTYQIRLMAKIKVADNANNTYISGGRGTSIDPYLITDGVKVS